MLTSLALCCPGDQSVRRMKVHPRTASLKTHSVTYWGEGGRQEGGGQRLLHFNTERGPFSRRMLGTLVIFVVFLISFLCTYILFLSCIIASVFTLSVTWSIVQLHCTGRKYSLRGPRWWRDKGSHLANRTSWSIQVLFLNHPLASS